MTSKRVLASLLGEVMTLTRITTLFFCISFVFPVLSSDGLVKPTSIKFVDVKEHEVVVEVKVPQVAKEDRFIKYVCLRYREKDSDQPFKEKTFAIKKFPAEETYKLKPLEQYTEFEVKAATCDKTRSGEYTAIKVVKTKGKMHFFFCFSQLFFEKMQVLNEFNSSGCKIFT